MNSPLKTGCEMLQNKGKMTIFAENSGEYVYR